MICELSSLFSILWPLNQAFVPYTRLRKPGKVEKALPATKRGPQLNSLTADLGYPFTFSTQGYTHTLRGKPVRPWHSPARTSRGSCIHPDPATPAARGPLAGGFGKGPPGLSHAGRSPFAPHRAFRPCPRPVLGPSRPGQGDSVSGLPSRPAGSGDSAWLLPWLLWPLPARPPLLGTHPEPAAEHVGGALSGRRGGLRGQGLAWKRHPGWSVGRSVVPTLRASVPKLPPWIPALLQPCPQDPNPGVFSRVWS